LLAPDLDHADRLLETLEPHGSTLDEADSLEPAGEADHRFGGEDLAGAGQAAKARRCVQSTAAVATLRRNGLACVEPDTDGERESRAIILWSAESRLEFNRRSERLAGGPEDAESLVTAKLDDVAVVRPDCGAGESGELGREPSCSFVALLLGESCVAAHVRNEERADGSTGQAALGQG